MGFFFFDWLKDLIEELFNGLFQNLESLFDRLSALFSRLPVASLLESDELFFAWQILAGLVAPIGGIVAGVALAHVRKERGWYLLSVVSAGLLARFITQMIVSGLLGYALWFSGAFPVPN